MRRLLVLAVFVALAPLPGISGQEDPSGTDPAQKPTPKAKAQNPANLPEFMRQKVAATHRVLEGLATEDFKSIEANAQRLSLLSLESQWSVLQTPDYVQYSAEFRRSAGAIHDAAKEKNLDAAALAYVDMTLKCVACHKHVRKVRMARVDSPDRKFGQTTPVRIPPSVIPVSGP
ncbi:MAG: hypothetical protein HYS13_24760 [Planctomycetia bacterium]|nr:hypothetical protein [Planctomycetia bacterium]